jgi:CBS domain-containing protein
MGILIGFAAVLITKAVYGVEDLFEKLPVHWMWWPALGGVAVGVIGYFFPRTLGVGYVNIDSILSAEFTAQFVFVFCSMKFLSWVIALGSGTSGGTLAPLFTIGGGLGTLIGSIGQALWPSLSIDLKAAALVGMAALFAGASRALLASVVFAFETTRQPMGLLPLLAGCTVSYLISSYFMKNTIMTEKIARRGVRVPDEYSADFLDSVFARQLLNRPLVTVSSDESVASVRTRLLNGELAHQSYPVTDRAGTLVGVITRRDLYALPPETKIIDSLKRKPITVFPETSFREIADIMTREKIGRVVIVARDNPRRPIGLITRGDVIGAHEVRLRGLQRIRREPAT